ncbi:MAG: hypothetical protein K9M75_10255 [Phycisphaerae bacterium]|nr:hypothetical protein [Phycisphaerae bacterium]
MVRFGLVLFSVVLMLVGGGCFSAVAGPSSASDSYMIQSDGDLVVIFAGDLARVINIKGGNVWTGSLAVGGEDILAGCDELSFRIENALPNRCPVGLDAKTAGSVTQKTTVSNSTDALDINQEGGSVSGDEVKWENPREFAGKSWGAVFNLVNCQYSSPEDGVKQVIIRARAIDDSMLKGLSINIFYQVYEGYPVIRKWVEVNNNSSNWLKLSDLVIDDVQVKEEFLNRTFLTPSERGAVSSIVGFGNSAETKGAVFASEVPSALRSIDDTGAMGYTKEYFEWILGPAESFVSEPVFIYGYSGDVVKTVSGSSTPLDRAVEKPFKKFLKEHVGVASTGVEIPAPLWCTWTNFAQNVTDEIIREQADIAARAGFELLQIDDGWQRGRLGAIPDTTKFPDFLSTCEYVRSKGIGVGLWVSCFRQADSDDIKALPDAPSVPEIRRHKGVAMSFSSPWSKYYGNQLVYLHDYYGATYFKQDFTNIKFGDFAKGHYSRSKKESLLRGLRGLFESQDILRAQAPEVANQLTHEIYWGTPGVPCDLAILKHAALYHIPPNDYSGVGQWKQRAGATDWWDKVDPKEQSAKLLKGCFNSRNRFYLHRGLPLECIEYYGASTVNVKGSLTGEIQDRQVCSWLMGAPTVFAGDMASLTEDNIKRYHDRFDIVKRLESQYGIYRNFQYSGVPAPTDSDWHWWGKLNENGEGAVVVIRGDGGEEKRAVNIPWVAAEKSYTVTALFGGKELGTFKGSDLIKGKLEIALPKSGQEILEVKRK